MAFLDVYGNADIDMHFITNASIIYSSLLANETTRRKKNIFFQCPFRCSKPTKSLLMIVVCDLFYQFFVETNMFLHGVR